QDEGGQPLIVGRQLVERVSLVSRRDRLNPLGLVRREVLQGRVSAVLLAVVDDRLGDVTLVEGVPATLCQRAKRSGEVFLDEDRTGRRGAAVHEERRGSGLGLLEFADLRGPVLRYFFRDRKALFRVCNGRREQIGEFHRAVLL